MTDIPPADDPSEWLEAFERFLSVLRDGGYDFGANAERALEKTVVRLYGQLNAAFLTAFGAPAEYTVSAVAKAMASKKGPDTWSPTRNPEIFWKEYLSKMRSLTENGMVSTSSAVELYVAMTENLELDDETRKILEDIAATGVAAPAASAADSFESGLEEEFVPVL